MPRGVLTLHLYMCAAFVCTVPVWMNKKTDQADARKPNINVFSSDFIQAVAVVTELRLDQTIIKLVRINVFIQLTKSPFQTFLIYTALI